MKITLEKALILFPVVTTKDKSTKDDNLAILTLSQDPLLVVSVNVRKSRALELCPYNLLCIDTTPKDKGYTLSCTGMLSHIQPLNKVPDCGYTFLSISVEEEDTITFDERALDAKTEQLLKAHRYSIYTVRSKVADYQGLLHWQQNRLENDENDASNEDNSSSSSSSTITESQEVNELDDDDSTTEEDNTQVIDDKHDTQPTITCFDNDDDDFQKPIIVVRSARSSSMNRMKSYEKKSKKTSNAPRCKRSRRNDDDDDDDDFQLPSKKKSRLFFYPPGTTTRTRRSLYMEWTRNITTN